MAQLSITSEQGGVLSFCFVFNSIVPLGFLPLKIEWLSPGEASCNRVALSPPSYAECFSVSIIHRTLTLTTKSFTCVQMLMHAIAHGSVGTPREKSALKADSGRKIHFRTWEWNLRQQRASLTLYQLSHIYSSLAKSELT